jgi:DNA topoisomerase-1
MKYIGIIVESPAKCAKIENILGSRYKCIACYGHFRELKRLKDIDFKNNFKLKFNISDDKLYHINKLKTFINNSDSIMIACDDDREGEAIGWHICDYFNLPITTTPRIKFNEITEQSIQNAVKHYGFLNMNMVNSQKARQVLDLIVGFSITPILWKTISYNSKNPLSAGRCQTPALKIIYDNQKKIENTPSKLTYNTFGYFTNKNLLFNLNKSFSSKEEVNIFLEDSVNFDHVFIKEDECKKEKKPPTPLTTSGLQQLASNNLNYSPKITMMSCQLLYEAGLITYMRTDSKTYSVEFINNTSKYIEHTYDNTYIHKDIMLLSERNNNDKNNVQEAHEAIRPTDINTNKIINTSKIGIKEIKLYNLIYQTTLESCMANSIYNSINATITAPNKYFYKINLDIIIFPGWKIVRGYETNNYNYNYIVNIKSQFIIKYNKIISEFTLTDLKTHYTEAKLVRKMEKLGIGRPSTFSSLVDKIQTRQYVKKQNIQGKSITHFDFELVGDCLNEIENSKTFKNEKNKLVIQPLGIIVIEFLNKYFSDLFNYEYTNNMENKLDLIAKNTLNWQTLCYDNYTLINNLRDDYNEITQLTTKEGEFKIDEIHSYIIGKYGPVIKCNNNGVITFKKVKDDVDIDKLKNNVLNLSDIISDKVNTDIIIGVFNDHNIIIRNGKYGHYISYKESNITIDKDKYDITDISLDISIEIINNYFDNLNNNLIRQINNHCSIRKGKYGDYIYYKTSKMKKPRFISLTKCKDDYINCDIKIILNLCI